ncbi:MAG: hypothetical protein P4L87_16060 [Formivibrio sp.]|nr:hypothetical protein [Formivibrio sp.]
MLLFLDERCMADPDRAQTPIQSDHRVKITGAGQQNLMIFLQGNLSAPEARQN